MKHSETPWNTPSGYTIRTETGQVIALVYGHDDAQRQANAELIVRAVNQQAAQEGK